MDCPTCQEHFTALLEESEDGSSGAGLHLAGCPTCTAEFAAFRRTVARLRDLPMVPPPPPLRGQISRALDAAEPAPGLVLWQPLAAGFSMAACLALVLWGAVLHPVSLVAYDPGAPLTMMAPAPTATPAVQAGPAVPAGPPAAAPERMRRRPAGPPRNMAPRTRLVRTAPQPVGQPPAYGSWGAPLAQLSLRPVAPGGGAGAAGIDPATGKPAGTFAAGDPTPGRVPLERRSGAVQLAFTPPPDKTVGTPTVGELTVVSEAEAMVVMRVQAQPGLRVLGAPQGVIYEGPMRHGETLRVPVRMVARQAGSYRLRVTLQGDVPGVEADLEIIIPGFVGVRGNNADTPVSLRFQDTPSLQALRELAAAAGARVVVHEDVDTQSVTLDFSAGVPFAAALRILCDECGYRIEERNGVYHVLR